MPRGDSSASGESPQPSWRTWTWRPWSGRPLLELAATMIVWMQPCGPRTLELARSHASALMMALLSARRRCLYWRPSQRGAASSPAPRLLPGCWL